MEDFEDLLPKYKYHFIFFLFVLAFIFIIAGLSWYFIRELNYLKETDISLEVEDKKEKEQPETYMIDIKGEVKKPGVYTLSSDKRVIDAVKEAGGFTNNADTSVNNLSMRLKDEMVIIIYSKKQIDDYVNTKKEEETKLEKCANEIKNDSCIDTKTVNTNNISNPERKEEIKEEKVGNKETNIKISINTASKSDLMKLSGIGESKANSIIEYRKTKKFEKIEDIKNVTGIGDSIFEKIKDNITV